jgi:hypothetical protein
MNVAAAETLIFLEDTRCDSEGDKEINNSDRRCCTSGQCGAISTDRREGLGSCAGPVRGIMRNGQKRVVLEGEGTAI